MEFRLLGPLEVHGPGGPVRLGGHKERALLALLLLHASRVVPRERLIDELWGDDPPETAVASVQVYVSRLRKVVPEGTLAARPPGYALEVEPGSVDAHRFEDLLAEARGSDATRASEVLREALGLWRGPALAEFREEQFGRLEGARLDELRLVALEDRIELDLGLGRHRDLVGELEALVAEHPHRERLCGQLMLALYRSGRQADALAAYRSARGALDELGLEPGAELKQLERRMLTQDEALGLEAEAPPSAERLVAAEEVALPGSLLADSPFPFVGREREVGRLLTLLERARAGEGALVLLSGEPGAGKTRLVRELAREAADSGVLVCYGGSDAAVTVPYQPLREWLEFLLRVCDATALRRCLGDGASALARIAPGLLRIAATDGQAAGDAAAIDRYSLQAAVVDALRRLGSMQPLLLVAEDVHWADDETLLLLGRLARAAPEGRMLVIATLRLPGAEIGRELGDALADLARLDGVERVALDKLDTDDVCLFVRDLTDADASAELLAAIGELTGGTPLFVCELWRELVATGAVEIADERVGLTRPAGELHGPERIGELVQQRLSRLSAETRRIVELAAVTGPRFDLRTVAAAADLDRAALVAAVEQATRAGVVEDLPAAAPTGRFTHELVRRAIYDRISGIRRAELHLRVGEALERLRASGTGGLVAELAHHYTQAAPLVGQETAIAYDLEAAQDAAAALAYGEASSRLEAALALGIADPRVRAHVQAELGYAYFECRRIGDAERILKASLEAATGLEERALATRALVNTLRVRLDHDPSARSAEFVAPAGEAIATFTELGDPLGLATAEYLLADALGREGRTEEALAAFDRAAEHARAAGDRALEGDIVGRIARRLCENATPVREAIRRITELRARSRHVPVLEAGIRRCLAVLLAMDARFDESRAEFAAADAVLDGTEAFSLAIASHWLAAEAKTVAGDPAGAEADLLTVFGAMRDARGDVPDANALRAAAMLALAHCDAGRWDEAADCLAYGEEVDRAEPAAGKVYAVLRLAARARVAAHDGRLDEALELARAGLAVAERSDWLNYRARVWLALSEVEQAAGNDAAAASATAEALRLYELKGNVAAASRLRGAQTPAGRPDGR